MQYLKGFVITLLIAIFVVINAPHASAATKFDAVSERINGDLAEIDTFLQNTNNPDMTELQFVSDMEKLDSRLQRSLEMYHDLTDFSDPSLKSIEPEIKELTRNIEGVHMAIVDLRKGIETRDQVVYKKGVTQLDQSLNNIDNTIIKIQEKAHSEENKDKQTELLYIAGTIASIAAAMALYARSKRPQTSEVMKQKAAAYNQLFKQSLAPMGGFIITLASFEYAKYTHATSYTIFTGLLAVGIIYFVIASYKYFFVLRPQLQKLA
jgi:predicted small secreted protein